VNYVVIVEHLEAELSPWLLLEYRHVSRIHGRDHTWFTNVAARYHRIIEIYGRVFEESVIDLLVSESAEFT
jgi:ribosome biogenesis SPOUT family RNA methylase Rps3